VICFVVEPTDTCTRELRRFVFSSKETCSGPYGYHDASVPFDVGAAIWTTHEGGHKSYSASEDGIPPHSDPRWPTHCPCGYAFTEADEWQVSTDLLYRRSDTGETWPLRSVPHGAMWRSDWYEPYYAGPDGQSWSVKLPDGAEWHIDGKANDGKAKGSGGWTRTGTPPRLTANPSILTCGYHGFLRDGALESC
jgi:hypothetical protein